MAGSTKEIYRRGYTYEVTRRVIQRSTGTVLRVRVRAWEGLLAIGKPEMDEFRDYPRIAEGDTVFFGHINRIEAH